GFLALLALPLALGLGLTRALRAWMPAPRPLRGQATAAPAASWQDALAPLLLLSWTLSYYAIVGNSFAKFARYMLPLLPSLALLLAGCLQWLAQSRRSLALWLGGALAFLSLGWGVGYGATYFRPHPWVETSSWVLQNIPRLTQDPS